MGLFSVGYHRPTILTKNNHREDQLVKAFLVNRTIAIILIADEVGSDKCAR